MSVKEKTLEQVDRAAQALDRSVIVKALLEGGLDLVPGIGAAITSALNQRAFSLFERNSRQFAWEVRAEFERVQEEKLDRDYLSSDEFVTFLLETLSRNARVHQAEKVRLFARLFVRLADVASSKTPFKEGFLQIVDQLSSQHVKALAFIYERATTFGDETNPSKGVSAADVAGAIGITQPIAEAYCVHLQRFGLVTDARVGTWDYEQGHFETTPYGRQFASLLCEQVG